jgi:hypothetical protein
MIHLSNRAFIEQVAKFAIKNYPEYKILPSLVIAQAILESNWGKSGLTKKNNNLFGIKGRGGDFQTKEFVNGKWITIVAGFRKYETFEGSIIDHSKLLNKPRYVKVKGETNYKEACEAVWKAGYATDPTYPQKLIKMIERLGLTVYDKQVIEPKTAPKPAEEKPKASTPAPVTKPAQKPNESQKQPSDAPLSKQDANRIIKILQQEWARVRSIEERQDVHRLANELRRITGQEMQ